MKKLAGLLAFAAALACAILVTRYYTTPPAPAPPPPPSPPTTATAPAAPDAGPNVPVTFKPQQVALDLGSKKGRVTLTLERDPARPAPESVWVWMYFFTPEADGRYCAGAPVEVRRPFDSGGRATVNVEAAVEGCPAPLKPSSTYYARVNVSSESAFAARLGEQRISYDVTQASPVVLENALPKKR